MDVTKGGTSMRYLKEGMMIEANGGWRVLESLGWKSEFMLAAESKKEEALAKYREQLQIKWTCPECGKTFPAMYQRSHHASHQRSRRAA